MRLLFWILCKLENTKYYDFFFNTFFGKDLEKLNVIDTINFVCLYLNRRYNRETKHPFAVFGILDAASLKVPIQELEEMAIECPYLESMPENEIFNYLNYSRYRQDVRLLQEGTLFKTYLTSIISDIDDLITLVNDEALVDTDYIYRKLAGTCSVNGLVYYKNKFRYCADARNLEAKLVDVDNFSLDELKEIFIKAKTSYEDVLNNLAKVYQRSEIDAEKDKVIDVVIEIAEYIPLYLKNSDLIKKKNGKFIEGIDSVCYHLAKSDTWTDEMKVRLAKKLLETRNFEFLYYWFLRSVECSYNNILIDRMLEESEDVLIDLLASVNESYLNYIVIKIMNKGEDVLTKVLDGLNCESLEISRFDAILAIVYHINYDYRVSRELAFNLAMAGSTYTTRFLNENDFKKPEREKMLDAYQYNILYQSLYGDYLMTGNKKDLAEQRLEKIRRRFIEIKDVKHQ